MGELLDLLLPRSCGGCGRAGTGWCADCAGALSGPPLRIRPRADPGVPCWALAAYRGAPRAAVLAVKEHYRWDLTKPLGFALARGLDHLRDTGRPLILVPAPSRMRGGAQAGRRSCGAFRDRRGGLATGLPTGTDVAHAARCA